MPWAELDENNVVLRVLVERSDDSDDGYGWLIENLGGRWVQTLYDGSIRKQYAGPGYTYDEQADVFIAPQPYPSWSLDGNHDWQPLVPRPEDGDWVWDEDTLTWVEVPVE